jgi:hypothetical protein
MSFAGGIDNSLYRVRFRCLLRHSMHRWLQTPRTAVLEKLTVVQLLNEVPTFNATERFSSAVWGSPILWMHFPPSHCFSKIPSYLLFMHKPTNVHLWSCSATYVFYS